MKYTPENWKLINYIGTPALLEQTAEEATELAFACLKYARYLRGENKVYGRTRESLLENLEEEIADVCICANELQEGYIIDTNNLYTMISDKTRRMIDRFQEEKTI